MKQFEHQFIHSRPVRVVIIGLVYGATLVVALWLSLQLRFDFFVREDPLDLVYLDQFWLMCLWIIPTKIIILLLFGQFSGLLSYFGTPDLYRILRAATVCSAVVGVVRIQVSGVAVPPRGVILIDFILSFLLLSGFRIGCRIFREGLTRPRELDSNPKKNIVIIGAGDVGASLARQLLLKPRLGRKPVAFVDDDRRKHNTSIHNLPVVGPPESIETIKQKLNLDEAIIAMPSASPKRISKIISVLQAEHLGFVTVPSLDQMATGKVRLSQLRPVEIQDLLGREPVSVARDTIRKMIAGRVVMVTGAGGSIGGELCRQVASFNPDRLLMVEQSEFLLFQMEQELISEGYSGIVLPLVANILDDSRMKGIFDRFRPDHIFHAAALKHVPMMESQPGEAIKVNALGTAKIAELAQSFKAKTFVLISTDKAINPTSVMGATKRLAEVYIQALFGSQDSEETAFMAVRFGNVLGSSGSVVPTFKKQIESGGPVKVTHPDVTRYFMTIPEAVGLVLQSGTQGAGGEIFVLDMGKSVKIVNLARQLIRLSGLRPDEDIEISFTGLRPGEKLFEELQHKGENVLETKHPKIRRYVSEASQLDEVRKTFEEFRSMVESSDLSEAKEKLRKAVPEYRPYLD